MQCNELSLSEKVYLRAPERLRERVAARYSTSHFLVLFTRQADQSSVCVQYQVQQGSGREIQCSHMDDLRLHGHGQKESVCVCLCVCIVPTSCSLPRCLNTVSMDLPVLSGLMFTPSLRSDSRNHALPLTPSRNWEDTHTQTQEHTDREATRL